MIESNYRLMCFWSEEKEADTSSMPFEVIIIYISK